MSARRIVLCLPSDTPFFDPMPEETAKRDVELSAEWDGTPAGVVGWAEGGWAALTLAAEHKQLVDRLVLVSAPAPGTEPKTIDLDSIQAKTLLLYGMRDEAVSHADRNWWRDRLKARFEMVPNGGHNILVERWARILSHLAPHTLRMH
jgi:pimeloyl-ACP methyl ester carboxylesterase